MQFEDFSLENQRFLLSSSYEGWLWITWVFEIKHSEGCLLKKCAKFQIPWTSISLSQFSQAYKDLFDCKKGVHVELYMAVLKALVAWAVVYSFQLNFNF